MPLKSFTDSQTPDQYCRITAVTLLLWDFSLKRIFGSIIKCKGLYPVIGKSCYRHYFAVIFFIYPAVCLSKQLFFIKEYISGEKFIEIGISA